MRISFALVLAACTFAAQASAQVAPADAPAPVTDSVVGKGPIFEEPSLMQRGIRFVSPYMSSSGHERGTGVYPDVGGMITGAGWLSAGPGYRYWFGHQAFVDGSAAVSWHTYKQANLQFEVPRLAGGRLAVGSQLQWSDFTQVHYFGIGPDLAETDSEYRIKTTDVVGYAKYRAKTWLSFDGQVGWLDRPTISSSAGWFDADYAFTGTVFPNDPAVGIRPPSYVHGSLAVTADNRDFPSYPTTGGLVRTSWSTYSDRNFDRYNFQRWEVEAAKFVPVIRDRWVLALHGWGVFTDLSPNNEVPFYLLPSLGGGNTLRGDRNYRYHDNDLLVVNAESRFGIYEHMDLSFFVDAGNVGPDFSSVNLDKRSYGAGVRFHTRSSTLARFDLAHGSEQGWRFMLKLNDPLRMGRLKQRNAPVPFVP